MIIPMFLSFTLKFVSFFHFFCFFPFINFLVFSVSSFPPTSNHFLLISPLSSILS